MKAFLLQAISCHRKIYVQEYHEADGFQVRERALMMSSFRIGYDSKKILIFIPYL